MVIRKGHASRALKLLISTSFRRTPHFRIAHDLTLRQAQADDGSSKRKHDNDSSNSNDNDGYELVDGTGGEVGNGPGGGTRNK